MNETDAIELMGQYCEGDRAAFQALYGLLARRILAYLMGLVGERATAEDLLQQTFLKLHEARTIYVRGANPVPWLYTIAHRSFIDEYRRRRRTLVQLTADGTLEAPAAHIDGRPSARAEAEGASARGLAAREALDRLPSNQREVLRLTKVEGLSLAEAAVITGCTPGALKLRAHRAYVNLRQSLAVGGPTQELA